MASDRRDLIAAFGYGPRAVCRLCGLAFRRDDHGEDAEICADCVEYEPGPFQDNTPPYGEEVIWHGPLQAPEIVVAQALRAEAERAARDAFSAAVFLHEALTAIAGEKGRPLKLFPRDQSKRAQMALEMFAENFPELLEAMGDLPGLVESAKLQ
jgi:hypothetical protein